LTYPLNRSE